MKKAFKKPYIGTRAELKRESIRNLKELVAYLNWYKGRAVICKNMIVKLLGIYKSWNYLTKQGLIDILTAWKNLTNRWAKSRHYTERRVGSEVYIMRGDSVYKRYLPAQKLWEARAIASECTGLWIAIRKAKRCLGFKWEVEEWHPDSEQDLLSTIHKTFSNAGTFTKKESPDNPFCNTKNDEIPTGSDLIETLIEATGMKRAIDLDYQDIFDSSPTEGVKEYNFFPEKTEDEKFIDSSIEETTQAAEMTGWKYEIINTNLAPSTTSILHDEEFIIRFDTGEIKPAQKTKQFGIEITLIPEEKITYKIANVPGKGKGWVIKAASKIRNYASKFYNSLIELIESETNFSYF